MRDASTLLRWMLPVGVVALAAGLFLGRLGERALWSEELRWAQIPREMALNADAFWPTINGASYFDKPVGSYWLVLLASGFTGAIDETSARLPSAVAGLLGVVLVMILARRLYDSRTATLAGLILATSFSYVFFARTASADMENLTGILAALTILVWHEDRPAGAWVIVAWLVMAGTSLTKGLLGFALPLFIFTLAACGKTGWRDFTDRLWHGPLRSRLAWLVERNRWLFNRWSAVAVPLAVLAFLAPFALAADHDGPERGLALVYRENLQRFFHPHNHRGPIYLYSYVVFALLAPWSALLPAALVQTLHACRIEGPTQRGDRFALAYFGATFLFFTLAASRRSYYILPILPAAALLLARLLSSRREELTSLARWLLAGGLAVVSSLVALVGLALLPRDWLPIGPWTPLPSIPAGAFLALAWLACLASVVYAWCDLRPGRVAVAIGVVAGLSMSYVYLAALPALEVYRTGKPFALRVKERLGDDLRSLGLYRTREPVFYLGSAEPIQEFDEKEPLRRAIDAGKLRWLIVRGRDLSDLPSTATIVDRETTFPWEEAEGKGTRMLLVQLGPA